MSIALDQVTKRYQIGAGRQRRLAQGRAGRVPGAARPQRQRQEHAAARHRRADRGRPRPGLAARPRRDPRVGARPRGRLRLPALRAVPPHDGGRQHRVRAARAQGQGRGAARAPQGTAAPGRARGHGRPPADAALGRPAAAHRGRAGARAPAAGAADGRALRRAGRQDPRGTAPHDPPDPARARHDDHPRHPRPGGGVRARRPHRRDAPGPTARVRPSRRPLHAPADALRVDVPRRGQPAARLPDGRRRPVQLRRSPTGEAVPREVVAVLRPEEVELGADEQRSCVPTSSGYGEVEEVLFAGAVERLRVRMAGDGPVAGRARPRRLAGRRIAAGGLAHPAGAARLPGGRRAGGSPSARAACTSCPRRSRASRVVADTEDGAARAARVAAAVDAAAPA